MGWGVALGIGANLLGGLFGSRAADKAKRDAKEKERLARQEMDRLKDMYSNLDTSNPYLNMENTLEDLTINQQQAQFQQQQFQQSQANILDSLRGAAGGSGIAAMAQALAQQGQLAAQRSAVDIGRQESQNQLLRQQEAGRLQGLEREGEIQSRDWERDKVSTLLGMAQGDTAAARQGVAAAKQAKAQAWSGALSGIGSSITAGISSGAFGGGGGGSTPTPEGSDRRLKKNIKLIGKSPSGLRIYAFEYIDKIFGEGVYQGVMSDEIPQHAVVRYNDGYDRVDYSKIDVEFKNIN